MQRRPLRLTQRRAARLSVDEPLIQTPSLMEADRPIIHGLLVHRDLRHRFSLLHPEEWVASPVPPEAGGGMLFYLATEEPHTSFLAQGHRLQVQVSPEDLHALHAGFLEGLRQLPGAEIESEEATGVGQLVSLEARHTFRDEAAGAAARKRWTRLLYQGKTQITLIAQATSPERFAFWEPAFNTAMRTVKFGDWWAEATGISWAPSLHTTPNARSARRRRSTGAARSNDSKA